MYPSVSAVFSPFSKQFEGWVPWMYVDSEDLVTTGMGNKIDPVSDATVIPWRHGVGGPLASTDEIRAAWTVVKQSGLSGIGGGNQKFAMLNDLRLSDSDIADLILQRVAENEAILRRQFHGYDSMPADAQLALHSLTWGRGAEGYEQAYPRFTAALNALTPDYDLAANESAINHPVNDSIHRRNLANADLLHTAANVYRQNLDPSKLYAQSATKFLGSGGGSLGGGGSSGSSALGAAAKTAALAGVGGLLFSAYKQGLIRIPRSLTLPSFGKGH